MKINPHSETNQRICGRLVEGEVIYCISQLVYELAQKAEHFRDWEDDLYGAFEGNPNYEEAAFQAGWNRQNDGVFINGDQKNDTAEDWQELCEDEGIDANDYRPDVYEHWLVSNWLAGKLENHGEKVIRDFFGFNAVWCRTTTGQMISMDSVIWKIAEEMEILEGQKNSWA